MSDNSDQKDQKNRRHSHRKSGQKKRSFRPKKKPNNTQKAKTQDLSTHDSSQKEEFKTKKSNYRNRRPKGPTPNKTQQKYDNLLEQYLNARKKLFEYHGRSSKKQLHKIELNLERTLRELRNFESSLKDWQKEVLKEKIDMYPADRQFSSDHELNINTTVPFSGEFDDPHLTQEQKSCDFKHDTEETIGTIQDYYDYKGIVPQEKT